jgi:hypothetical protein
VVQSLERPNGPDRPEPPRCHCGASAKYEVDRKSGVTLVCAQRVPETL